MNKIIELKNGCLSGPKAAEAMLTMLLNCLLSSLSKRPKKCIFGLSPKKLFVNIEKISVEELLISFYLYTCTPIQLYYLSVYLSIAIYALFFFCFAFCRGQAG